MLYAFLQCEGSRSGSRSASLTSPQMTLLPPSGLMVDSHHSTRLNSVGSDQEQDVSTSSATSNEARMKKTLEERMNEMVDAVFGHPKHELLKLVQRSSPNDESMAQQSSIEPSVDVVFDIGVSSSPFKHDFQEISSFRPCTCAHCNGLVKEM